MDTAVAENDSYAPGIEELDYKGTESGQPERPVWFKWMWAITLLIMLVGILLGSGSYLAGSMLALLNCTLVAWAMVKLAEKRSVCCLFPIVFLTWLILGCSVAPIYFSIFNKEATYMYYESMLGGNIKYQSAVLTFLIPYIIVTLWTFRNEKPYAPMPVPLAKRLSLVVICLFTFSALVFVIVQALHLPGEGYAGTFLNYTTCLPLILGVYITQMSKKIKMVLIGYFAFMLFFFALANARRYAMVPIVALLFGLFFISNLSTKVKVTLILICFIAFPAYMVIGNTVRALLGEVGFEDLAYRAKLLGQWKYVAQQVSWADSVFGRLFFTGGHAVITRTPEEVQYIGFEPDRYLYELAIVMIPGKILEQMQFFVQAKYAYNFPLLNYGFELTEEHQVGISLLGHFWIMGGYLFMVIGAVIVSFVQWASCLFVNRNLKLKPDKGLFIAAFIFPSFVWMSGNGFINVFRELFWQIVLAVAFYYVFVWFFMPKGYTPSMEHSGYTELQAYESY